MRAECDIMVHVPAIFKEGKLNHIKNTCSPEVTLETYEHLIFYKPGNTAGL
jgi:hypothetical protein